MILAGGGVRRSAGGPEALVALAELLDAPVVSTVGGKGAIPFDHPLSAASWIEDRYTTELLEDADVLLAVGHVDGRGDEQLLHLPSARPADPRRCRTAGARGQPSRPWASTPTPRWRLQAIAKQVSRETRARVP